MRRSYESEAIRRANDDQFAPNERDTDDRPQAMRWINSTALSRQLVPHWLRHRAVSVAVATPREEYPTGTAVPFRVTLRNAMPFPITLRTNSPLPWTWAVDGVREASHVSLCDPPEESGAFRFDRGERKQFTKRWPQMFRTSESEWEPVGPGEYTISAGLNVENPTEKGLYGETTVRIVPAE